MRHRPDEVRIYQGREGAIAFFNNVYETAYRKGREIILVCTSEQPFVDALGDFDQIYIDKMRSIKDRMSMKCLLTGEDLFLPCASYSAYRRLSKGYVDSVPFYIYDDKYALFVFDATPSPKIMVLQSRFIADAFRRQFHSMWDKATPLTAPAKTAAAPKKERRKS